MYIDQPHHFRTMIPELLLGSYQECGTCFSASPLMAQACDVAQKPLRSVNHILLTQMLQMQIQ